MSSIEDAQASDDALPILQRRRIEANIIAPIYREMVNELGEAKARDIIRTAIAQDARAAGARFAAREPNGPSIKTFLHVVEKWKHNDALRLETLACTDEELDFNVQRCAYAEMYREMGLADIGELLSCTRDEEFTAGFDPKLQFRRTQTLMSGAPYCDFRYRRSPD